MVSRKSLDVYRFRGRGVFFVFIVVFKDVVLDILFKVRLLVLLCLRVGNNIKVEFIYTYLFIGSFLL